MGKCQQTMNRTRKTQQQQRKEDKRALRLRLGLVEKHKAEVARCRGPARTGKQAREPLKQARGAGEARGEAKEEDVWRPSAPPPGQRREWKE